MNHSIVRKLGGGEKLLFVATRVTAFTVPLVVGMLNTPALRAHVEDCGKCAANSRHNRHLARFAKGRPFAQRIHLIRR
jgi:hypothetical protein